MSRYRYQPDRVHARPTSTRTKRRHAFAEALEGRRLLAVHLVEDINRTPAHGFPTAPFDIGSGVALFEHGTGATGAELFRTDGTAAGTYLVKDIFPGSHGSHPHDFAHAGDVGYFLVDDGPTYNASVTRNELWRSDGTAAGTISVLENDPLGPRAGGGITPVGPGRRAFFLAEDVTHGFEWWLTDGEPNDARLVADLAPGFAGIGPTAWGTQGTVLLFQSQHQPGVLYASDGTAAGTVPVATGVEVLSGGPNVGHTNLAYSNVGFSNAGFFRVGNVAYFVDQTTGSLWRTDGTAAGTTRVVDRAMPDLRLIEVVTAGESIVFAGLRRSDEDLRMFRYDPGLGVRPVLLPSGAFPDRGGNYPLRVTAVGETVYFAAVASVPSGGFGRHGVYRIPAGSATAALVPGMPEYAGRWGPTDLTAVGHTLYARLNEADLWKVPGPTSDGVMVTRLPQKPGDPHWVGVPTHFAGLGGYLLLVAYDPVAGYELHRSDGTADGAKLIADSSPMTESSAPLDMAPFGDRYLFSADNGVHGREPYVTDGTAAGTFSLGDLNPGLAASHPREFTTVQTDAGPRAFFNASDGGGAQLWMTDGTPTGTRRVKVIDPRPFTSGYSPRSITAGLGPARGVVFFVADDGVHGHEVWRSDGTDTRTFMIADVQRGEFVGEPTELTALPDGSLLFNADDGANGIELWKTDGTTAGTAMIKNVRPDVGAPGEPAAGSHPRNLTLVAGHVYFSADDGTHGQELWRTDGTPDGTVMVADIQAGPESSDPGDGGWQHADFVPFDGNVYFSARQIGTGSELWRTDGTAAGTALVADVLPGPAASAPNLLRRAGDRLYFAAAHGDPSAPHVWARQVWSTDGTAGGTTLVLRPDVARDVEDMAVIAGRLFFRAAVIPSANVPSGVELFTTDGTPDGTRQVEDLGGDSNISRILLGPMPLPDGSILVVGTDPLVFTELLRYDNPWPHVVGRHVFYNRSSFDDNDPAANAADDAAVAADKNALLAGQDRLPGFDNVTSYDRGINGVMIDVANLPETGAPLDAGDFDFGAAGSPASVEVRRGAGFSGADRITLVWRDYNPQDASPLPQAVGNGWLTVTAKANARTGLAQADVFSFGNLIGETGEARATPGWRVNALDLAATKRTLNAAATVTSVTDFNRDGRTNALDAAVVKRNLNGTLGLMGAAPSVVAPVFAPIGETFPSRRRASVVSALLE